MSLESHKPSLVGEVVSNKMMKTVSVLIERRVKDSVGKVLKKSSKLLADVPSGLLLTPGDKVMIEETRPISRRKSWVVVSVLEKARGL